MRRAGSERRCAWLNAVLLAAMLPIAACSSGGPSLFEAVGDLALLKVTGAEVEPGPAPSRAELNRIPFATISVAVADGPRAYLVPLANNDGNLDYRDAEENSVRMRGGALSGVEVVGHDLDAVRHGSEDPIAYPRPLSEWPSEIWREYQFSIRDLTSYAISLKCVYQPVAKERIEIVELSYDLTRVAEICTNARRQVVNTYWVDESTGFIWKSEQWGGPELGSVSVEIIRPFAG